MTKIFCTGTTGYIGGDALYLFTTKHPEYEITCLVRNESKGAKVTSQHPKIRLVYGDLDSHDLIVEEASKADVVCHFANCDHEASANAIVEGMSKASHPVYLIHTSGTGILEVDDLVAKSYGNPSDKIYDDWDGIDAVTHLRDEAWHRNVDKIILAANTSSPNIHTAIVCPPTIYGPGRGPDNRDSDQVYKLTDAYLARKKPFQVGKGQNRWTYIHVHDLSQLYLDLVEAAVAGGGKATWDDQGYYFAENGEYVWGELAGLVASECKKRGFVETDGLESLEAKEVDAIIPFGRAKWGMNSRCKAIRARKLFGWSPKGRTLQEEVPDIVQGRAKAAGLVKG